MYFTEAEAILELSPPYTRDDLTKAWRKKSKELHPEAGGRDVPGSEERFKRAHRAKELLSKRLSDPRMVQDSRPGDPDYRPPPPPQPPKHAKPVPPQPPGRSSRVPPQPPPKRGPPQPPPPPEGYRSGRPGEGASYVKGARLIGLGVPGSDLFGRRSYAGMPVSISRPVSSPSVSPDVLPLVGQPLRVSQLSLDGRPHPAPWRFSSWVAVTTGKKGGKLAVALQPPSPLPPFNRVEALVSFEEDDENDVFRVFGPVVERSYADGGLVSLMFVELGAM